ncbi:hypothetical protein QYF36_014250 [Acer negundo]|nr:hypothetical protein QYF36_014250 [Acer negundo]
MGLQTECLPSIHVRILNLSSPCISLVEKKLTSLSKEMTLVEVESMALVVFQENDTWSRATEHILFALLGKEADLFDMDGGKVIPYVSNWRSCSYTTFY